MILIKGGTVHNGKGDVYRNTDILIDRGLIKKIGTHIEVSEDTKAYNANGKTVLPGFIDSLNIWGCKGPGWGDDDLGEHTDPITPEMNAVFAFDQDSMMFQRVFEYGVTCAGITPSTSNVIGGQIAVFKTYGKHPYEMLVKENAAMASSITKETRKTYGSKDLCPMTRMGAISLLKEAIVKAQEYKKGKKEKYDPKSVALQGVINKEIPLFINCNTKSDMDAVELALKDFPVNIVFTGAFGADGNTGNILRDRFSIILGDLTNAMTTDNKNVNFSGINELIDKGIDVAISCCGDKRASGKESLLWNAILYHKYGINEKNVLKMITSVPAKLLGVEDSIGSIEAGKDADITIWTDNPIKTYSAKIEATFIGGENILYSRRENTCWS